MCGRKYVALNTSKDIDVTTWQSYILAKGKPAYLHANLATQSLSVSHHVVTDAITVLPQVQADQRVTYLIGIRVNHIKDISPKRTCPLTRP